MILMWQNSKAVNYHTWQFAIRNYLEMNQLEKCIIPSEADNKIAAEKDGAKLSQAKTRLFLSVVETLFVHIEKCTSALEIWIKFQGLYEDKGFMRKIRLLCTLISIRLEDCDSMKMYIDQLTHTSYKLNSIGFEINDDWLGAIMFAGLTDDFKPMVLSFEGSNTAISADTIKMKLLDTQFAKVKTNDNAFFGKKAKANRRHVIKCYNCGGKGHKISECKNTNSNWDTLTTTICVKCVMVL